MSQILGKNDSLIKQINDKIDNSKGRDPEDSADRIALFWR